MSDGHSFSRAGILRLIEQPLISLSGWVILPLLFALVFGDELSRVYRRVPTLALSFTFIGAALIAINWEHIRSSVYQQMPFVPRLHWGWAMVGLAVVLRHALLQFLPPDIPINGEEIQMGGDSMLIVLGADLPVSYRFTVIMGTIGFELTDNSLDALRVVFRLAGSLSIVVLALTLRRLSIGWPATLLAVFTMSSLSLLVVGGGVAYENFSGIIFEVLLLYCVVGATTSRDNALVWAGFAGLFGGVLMHEFDSFKAIVILPPLFWFVRSVLTEEPECRRSALRSGGMYIILLTLTGAAAFADLVNNPTTSSLVDGLRRHSLERDSSSPDAIHYLQNSGKLAWNYTQALFGQNPQLAPAAFRIGDGGVVPLVPGMLFVLSILYALIGKAGLFSRIAALVVLLMLATVGFLANNFTLERIIPALPILVLLSGIGVDSVVKGLTGVEGTSDSIRKNPLVYSTALTALIVVVNVMGVVKMSSTESVLREYQNHQYFVCLTIAEERREFEFERVLLFSDGDCNKGDDLWLYPDMSAEIHRVDTMPTDAELEAATLVVVGRVHGLSESSLANAAQLAWRTKSSHTLRSRDNLLGDVVTMSFCNRCDKVVH